ncbi:tRNA lysidine(34) synthetase TilS [Candidatus Peribacteria bacterium]|nr:tRNA lysidine(34) synthetase TilS [Candidatus Peribacteria bacterium]
MHELSAVLPTIAAFHEASLASRTPVCIAVSGGVDSMVLLHSYQQLVGPEHLLALQIHHGTGHYADAALQLVQQYCAEQAIRCRVYHLPPPPTSNKEATWRAARQEIFAQVIATEPVDRVLTAHHAGDLTETMLYRFITGASAHGLSPLDPSTRPLLPLSKSTLIAYAAAYAVPYLEDPSNADTSYARNRLRQAVVPECEHITPHLDQVMGRSAAYFARLSDYLRATVAPYLERDSLPLREFVALHPFLQSELLYQMAGQAVGTRELHDALRWLRTQPQGGTRKRLGGVTLQLRRGLLCWEELLP